jgi:uncharacterized membrane protein
MAIQEARMTAQSNVLFGARPSGSALTIRTIGTQDLKDSLRLGLADFNAMPTHAVFLCLIYPIVGLVPARMAFGYAVLPLLYPLISGFALVGPVAALGLYELSRRRESGDETSLAHAFDVLNSSSLAAIAAVAVLLFAIFFAWIAVANALYVAAFGNVAPESISSFVHDVFTTQAGWNLIVFGNIIGFGFAVVVLAISVVSFPLLLDRDVGAATALQTSIRAVRQNPRTMAIWGLIVASLLVLGSLPLFIGLTVVMPVLGHATWHLYRKVIVADGAPRPVVTPEPASRRSAADFPANLFPWLK